MKHAMYINGGLAMVFMCVWSHPAEIHGSAKDERRRTIVSGALI